MKQFFLAFFLFFLFLISPFSGIAQPEFILNKADAEQPVAYLKDTSGDLTLAEVRRLAAEGALMTAMPAEMTIEEHPVVYWVAFRITNQGEENLQRFLDFNPWQYVDFYALDPEGKVDHQRSGQLVPFRKRNHGLANRSLVKVELPGGTEQAFFVRLESSLNSEILPLTFEFKVVTPEEAERWKFNTIGLVMFFTGIGIVMFLYHLFIYFSTRDRDFLYYLVILFMMIFVPVLNFGFAPEFFPDQEWLVTYGPAIGVGISVIVGFTMLLFTNEFFKVRERLPWLWRWSMVLLGLFVLPIFPFLSLNSIMALNLTAMVSLLTLLTVLVIAIQGVISHYPSAWYFVLAQSLFLVFGLVTMLAAFEVLPLDEFTRASAPAGATAQNIFLAFAIANKLNILRKENDQRKMEVIQQLEENKKLQTKVNRELEQKVQERTTELNLTNKELQRTNLELNSTLKLVKEERQKSDDLLLNILPEATAVELKEKGVATPRYYDLVTVLFADFVGFSRVASFLSPEEIIRYLNRYFVAFDQILERHNVEKIKTIGDAYMCAGGIPIANTTNPVDTLKVALEMQAFAIKFKAEGMPGLKGDWDLRVGLHSGELVAGVIGNKKFAYDIWGDTVNIASRLERACEPGKVNISEQTYQLIKDQYPCTYRGEIEIKNIGKIGMYFVENPFLLGELPL